jgi:hypothetical protein
MHPVRARLHSFDDADSFFRQGDAHRAFALRSPTVVPLPSFRGPARLGGAAPPPTDPLNSLEPSRPPACVAIMRTRAPAYLPSHIPNERSRSPRPRNGRPLGQRRSKTEAVPPARFLHAAVRIQARASTGGGARDGCGTPQGQHTMMPRPPYLRLRQLPTGPDSP